MKKTLIILIILIYFQSFGQETEKPNYSKEIEYRENLDITISANNSDFLISLNGENISAKNIDDNQINIKNNKEKHKKFIEILKKYNPSNEIYFFNSDDQNETFYYETNTNRKLKKIPEITTLTLQIDYLGICGDMFFVYFFDANISTNFINELTEIYGNKKSFNKLKLLVNKNVSNAEIQGIVHSTVNNKLVTQKVYITETTTKQTVKADENGKFILRNLKRNTDYIINISAYNYKDTAFEIKTNDSIVKKYFDLKGNCEYNRKSAKRDWKNGTAKLLLNTNGINGNYANRSKENKFELKYNIEYISFGCMPPNEKCIKEYNKQIFKLLDKKYGKIWRKETRFDVANLDKKDIEFIINRIKNKNAVQHKLVPIRNI